MARAETTVLILLVADIFLIAFLLPMVYSPAVDPGVVCVDGPPLTTVNGTGSNGACTGMLPHYESLTYHYLRVGAYYSVPVANPEIRGTYWIKYWVTLTSWIQV